MRRSQHHFHSTCTGAAGNRGQHLNLHRTPSRVYAGSYGNESIGVGSNNRRHRRQDHRLRARSGRCWPQHQGLCGDGCTLHRIDNGIDTGSLIAHICPEVGEGDNELTLFWRGVRDSADVYVEMLERLARGERVGEPQREWGRLYQVKDRTWQAERQLAARMRDGLLRGLHLPARVHWFGVPAMPPTGSQPYAQQPEREQR